MVTLTRECVDTGAAPPGTRADVTTIPALLTALAVDANTEIVVANGIYYVTGASFKDPDSLWIGSLFASRTNPVLVRAETPGGVTFDGGGANGFGGLFFEEGAHDQTWQGFVFANGTPTSTGVIVFGGYPGLAAPHHITLRNITLATSCVSSTPIGTSLDQGVYFSQALGGVHDILIDGLTHVAAAGELGLDSLIQFYHSSTDNPNAWNVTIRNVTTSGGEMPITIWDPTLNNIVIEDVTISGAIRYAVRYETPGTGIVLRRVVSTGSGVGGFYSSLGAAPAGLTFVDCSLA